MSGGRESELLGEEIFTVVDDAVGKAGARGGEGNRTVIFLATSFGTEADGLLRCMNSLEIQSCRNGDWQSLEHVDGGGETLGRECMNRRKPSLVDC